MRRDRDKQPVQGEGRGSHNNWELRTERAKDMATQAALSPALGKGQSNCGQEEGSRHRNNAACGSETHTPTGGQSDAGSVGALERF